MRCIADREPILVLRQVSDAAKRGIAIACLGLASSMILMQHATFFGYTNQLVRDIYGLALHTTLFVVLTIAARES